MPIPHRQVPPYWPGPKNTIATPNIAGGWLCHAYGNYLVLFIGKIFSLRSANGILDFAMRPTFPPTEGSNHFLDNCLRWWCWCEKLILTFVRWPTTTQEGSPTLISISHQKHRFNSHWLLEYKVLKRICSKTQNRATKAKGNTQQTSTRTRLWRRSEVMMLQSLCSSI